MRTFVIAFLSLFLGLGNVNAQGDNSLLWEVSGNDLATSSYLFGTIHVMCPDELELKEKVETALDETERIVLELDMDDPSFIAELQQYAFNPGMENIAEKLSDEDRAMLNEFFQKHYNATIEQLGIMRPFSLLSMMFIKGLDCDMPGSYEELLMGEAKSREFDILGLETVADQVGVFDQVSVEEQLAWLVDYAQNLDDFKSDIEKLLNAYKAEDVEALGDLMDDYPEYKVIEEAILYERNENWIEPITQMAAEQPTFFAFGAGHLGSDRGVIELLRKEGYTVTPIYE